MEYIEGSSLKNTWDLNGDIRKVSYDTFRKRVNKNMDTYEALTTEEKKGRKKKPLTLFWEKNKHRAVVPVDTYKVRVNRDGMTFEEALTTEKKRTNDTSDEYVKWSNVGVENGVKKAYFWQRVNVYNFSYERAATEPVIERKKRSDEDTEEDMFIEKDSDRVVKKMIISLLNAGEPVPKKYVKRFPELFENRI